MQKEKVRQILDAFPEDIDIDVLTDKLHLLDKIEIAEGELARGEGIPDEEIEEYEPSALAHDTDEPRRIFHELATEWKAGRGHCSKAKDLAMHPAYQRIIGMGETPAALTTSGTAAWVSVWYWPSSGLKNENVSGGSSCTSEFCGEMICSKVLAP